MYCAKCGVEMEKYQAPPPPFLEGLLLNGPLQVFVAVLILSGMGLYLVNKNLFENEISQKQSRRALKFVPSNSVAGPESTIGLSSEENFGEEEKKKASSPPLDSSEKHSPSAGLAGNTETRMDSGNEKNNGLELNKANRTPSSSEGSSPEPPKETVGANASSIKPHLRISVYEMQTFYRDQLIESSGAQGLFSKESVFPSGILPSSTAASRSVGQYSSFVFSDQKILSSESPNWKSLWAHQIPNGGPTLGLEFEVLLNKASSKALNLTVFIRRQWFSSLEGSLLLDQPLEFGQSFELEKGQGFFVVNLFPATSLPGEKALFNTPLSKVVSSAAFKNRLTDFIFVIDEIP